MHCFRDSHEKALHLWMRDRNRTALGDLAFKDGNDAAAAAEYIPKTDSDECSAESLRSIVYDHLSNALSCAHPYTSSKWGWNDNMNGLIRKKKGGVSVFDI